MVRHDQTQEAMATIRMAVDIYDDELKKPQENAEDAGDFIVCNDDNENSGSDQFEPVKRGGLYPQVSD
jgi:hypothetical protein